MAWSTESRHTRGYGAAWDKLRLTILARDHYICQCDQCGLKRPTPATEVDHITPKAKGGTDDPANLRAVASECHKRITAQQQGKTYTPRRTIGADGWPVPGR